MNTKSELIHNLQEEVSLALQEVRQFQMRISDFLDNESFNDIAAFSLCSDLKKFTSELEKKVIGFQSTLSEIK